VHVVPVLCRHFQVGIVYVANAKSYTVHTVCYIVQFPSHRSHTFFGRHAHRIPISVQLGQIGKHRLIDIILRVSTTDQWRNLVMFEGGAGPD